MFTPPASGAFAPSDGASAAAASRPVWPIEPVVARDFALLKLQIASARGVPADIAAAESALGNERSRPVVLARAEAAIGRSDAHDPHANVALQRETEALQTWVAVHPKDSLAWATLARCAEPLGQRLRAIRAEGEAHAALGDLVGALDRLRAGQRMARTASAAAATSSMSPSSTSRVRELEAQRREILKDFGRQ